MQLCDRLMRWLVVVAVVAGCTKPNPSASCADGKCTNAAYAGTLRGRVVSDDDLRRLSDIDAMSASLRTYYLGQNDRSRGQDDRYLVRLANKHPVMCRSAKNGDSAHRPVT